MMNKEDIESFGFKYEKPVTLSTWLEEDETDIGGLYMHKELNIMLVHYPDSNRISIATIDPVKNDFYAQYNKDNYAIGSLEIKTREEMKFIMDRLPKK